MSSTTLTAVWSGSHAHVHLSASSASLAAAGAATALGPPPVQSTTGTNSSSSLLQSPLRNKRCSSSSSLDCQSLQSSLKRVRLSCSPGELRLQRDLGCLPAMGWTPETDIQDDCMMDSPMGMASIGGVGGPATTGTGTTGRPFALESNPRWFLQTSHLSAELQLLDPLRLVLSIQRPQRCSRLWIQIPRMYPHRPPVISRIENMAMEQIVVMEEPPGMPHGQDTCSGSMSGTTTMATLYYKEWSPVRHLGDLLLFLLQASAAPSHSLSRSTSFATSVGSTGSSVDGTSAHFTSSMTTEFASSSSSSCSAASASSTSSPNDVSSSATTIHRRHASPAQFMDEHKMDDVFVCYKNKVVECHDMAVQVLAPNRFDVGYGKYCNPLELQHRRSLPHQQQQHHDPNAMEM